MIRKETPIFADDFEYKNAMQMSKFYVEVMCKPRLELCWRPSDGGDGLFYAPFPVKK